MKINEFKENNETKKRGYGSENGGLKTGKY